MAQEAHFLECVARRRANIRRQWIGRGVAQSPIWNDETKKHEATNFAGIVTDVVFTHDRSDWPDALTVRGILDGQETHRTAPFYQWQPETSAAFVYTRRFYLMDYEANGHEDSDFYVGYWNAVSGSVEFDQYDTTRCGVGLVIGPSCYRPRDDMPETEKARLVRWVARRFLKLLIAQERGERTQLAHDAFFPHQMVELRIPLRVKIERKFRTFTPGTRFVVRWVGERWNGYTRRAESRIRLEAEDGTSFFTDAAGYKFRDAERKIVPVTELRAKAFKAAERLPIGFFRPTAGLNASALQTFLS